MSAPLHIFYSYAHEDEELLKRLDRHLKPLKNQGLIDTWNRSDVPLGQNLERELDSQLNSADIILLLNKCRFPSL